MPKYNLTWQATDSKFLDALLLATGGEGGVTLQDVLLMGDALDGEVFELKELEEALEKLLSAGFISLQKNKFSLTAAFLTKYEEITLAEGEDSDTKPLDTLLQQQTLTEESITAVRENILKKYKLKNHYQQYMEQYG